MCGFQVGMPFLLMAVTLLAARLPADAVSLNRGLRALETLIVWIAYRFTDPSQQRRDVSVSRYVAHDLPPFCMSWASPKPSVLETWDTERGFSKTKSSGSGKESPRLPKTGWSVLGLRSESAFKSRSSATHRGYREAKFRRWIESEPTSDRLEVRRLREESRKSKCRWFRLHGKNCEGTEVASLLDLSM